MKRTLVAFLLFLVSPLAAQQVRFFLLPKETVRERVSAFNGKDSSRGATLRHMFQESGCSQLTEQAVKGLSLPNLICLAPGETGQMIVVGAHYDHVDRGNGILDNWTGASLLPSLYASLAKEVRRHTFVFVAFSGEEKGMVGSRFYVQQIAEAQRPEYDAMVNLDTLGLGPTKVWASHADPDLLSALFGVAKAIQLEVAVVNVDQVGTADSEPFRQKHMPSITIHSVTQDTLHFLHTPEDNPSKLKLDDYYDTYRLLAAYLAYLDLRSPRSPEPPPSKAASQ